MTVWLSQMQQHIVPESYTELHQRLCPVSRGAYREGGARVSSHPLPGREKIYYKEYHIQYILQSQIHVIVSFS